MSTSSRKNATPARPILVLSAFAPELAPLRLALAGIPEAAVVCVAAGIGAVDAGIGAARALAKWTPRLALFIGTAGSYGPAPPLGAVVVARRLLLASSAAVRRQGYLPPPMCTRADTDPAVRRALLASASGHPAERAAAALSVRPSLADVANSLAITTSPALAAGLSRATRAAVENLEVFAVARAAARADVPFGAVLGITNRVGPRAHTQWVRQQQAATAAASRVLEAFLLTALLRSSRSSLRSSVRPSSRASLRSARPVRGPSRSSPRRR